MTDEDCLIGDDAIHGESAYTFGDETDISTLHGKSERDLEKSVKVVDVEAGEGELGEGELGEGSGSGSKGVKQS